jgi:glycosyltransferase 2 family protein
MSWWYLILAIVFFFCSQFVIVWRWHTLLSIKGIYIPLVTLLGYVLIGGFISNFLPSTIGGDIIKIVGLTRECTANKGLLTASVIVDRLYNITGMIILAPLAVIILSSQTSTFGNFEASGRVLSSFFLIPIFSHVWLKAKNTWQSAKEWFTSPWSIIILILLSIFSVSFGFASFWMVLLGLGMELSYFQAFAVCITAYFAALIPIAINGLGVQESVTSYLLMQFGATPDQAIAAAFSTRIVTLFVSLSGGLWLIIAGRDLLSLARKHQKEVKNEVTSEEL